MDKIFISLILVVVMSGSCSGEEPAQKDETDGGDEVIVEYKPSYLAMPSVFDANMVLQRQAEPSLWGTSRPGRIVTVTTSWNGRKYTATVDSEGKWKVKVSTPEAGGPYTVSVSDEGAPVTFDNVLIGDVWLASGQSNIEMVMGDSRNQGGAEALAQADNGNILFFNVFRATTLTPQYDVAESDGVHNNPCYRKWEPSTQQSARYFSAVSYYFARKIQEKLKIPIGIIYIGYGGGGIQSWMTPRSLEDIPEKPLPGPETNITRYPQQVPTLIYNGMVHPVVSYGIKGMIWYQGEANCGEPDLYVKMFDKMVSEYRTLWGMGDFPVYYCQIAPYNYGAVNSAFFREAQAKCMSVTPNVGMASLLDIGLQNDIHPGQKQPAGERLASLALAKTYGAGGEYTGPEPNGMTIEGHTVRLTFDHATGGLTAFGKPLTLFTIAGSNRQFYPATATIEGNTVILTSPSVQAPTAVRYAFQNWVVGELFNSEGFPASSFRTDEW
jgi:sialate O-acetylesterase